MSVRVAAFQLPTTGTIMLGGAVCFWQPCVFFRSRKKTPNYPNWIFATTQQNVFVAIKWRKIGKKIRNTNLKFYQ